MKFMSNEFSRFTLNNDVEDLTEKFSRLKINSNNISNIENSDSNNNLNNEYNENHNNTSIFKAKPIAYCGRKLQGNSSRSRLINNLKRKINEE
ncbi:1978_t:CDS:1, partial [Ambispora leptoticha]